MTTWREAFQQLNEACQGAPDQCVGGSPLDLWPVLVPVVLAVGLIGLIVKAIQVKRGGS